MDERENTCGGDWRQNRLRGKREKYQRGMREKTTVIVDERENKLEIREKNVRGMREKIVLNAMRKKEE